MKITRTMKLYDCTFVAIDNQSKTIQDTKTVTFVERPNTKRVNRTARELGMLFLSMEEREEKVWTTPELFYSLCKRTMENYPEDEK